MQLIGFFNSGTNQRLCLQTGLWISIWTLGIVKLIINKIKYLSTRTLADHIGFLLLVWWYCIFLEKYIVCKNQLPGSESIEFGYDTGYLLLILPKPRVLPLAQKNVSCFRVKTSRNGTTFLTTWNRQFRNGDIWLACRKLWLHSWMF
jgi:hypothetical protein